MKNKHDDIMKNPPLFLSCLLLCLSSAVQAQFTNTGNLKLHTGAAVTFFGNFTNNGTFTDSAQSVSFKGSSAQSISGSAQTAFNNLVVDNSSGVTMQRSIDVTNSLALTAGALTLNSNTLNINNSAGTAVTRTSGYVVSEQTDNSGKISWNIGTNTSLHRYPLGTAAGTYIPFELTLSSGNIGRVTVSTYPTAANNTPYPSTPVAVSNIDDAYGNNNSTNVVDRFWQIDRDGAGGTATLTFTATSAEIGTITGLQAQRWDAINGWEAPLPGQSNSTNTATVPGVTNFSPWTLSGNGSPLPITLFYFTATAVDNRYVDLHWETATEINNDYFTIEKTSDGINFETVMNIDGAGNSSQPLEYTARDDNPFGGISYYRLKQTDFNGGFTYSSFAPVEITAGLVFNMQVFPNPSEGSTRISVTGTGDELLSLSIMNASGSLVYEREITLKNGRSVFDLETTPVFIPGIYMIVVSGKDVYSSARLLVK